MPLETATHISDLVSSNPAASDGLNQADDHLRMIKSVLKTDFPNISAPVTLTAAQINDLVAKDVGSLVAFPIQPPGFANNGQAGAKFLDCNGATYNASDYPALNALWGTSFGGTPGVTFKTPVLSDTGRFLRHRSSLFGAGAPQAQSVISHQHGVSGSTGDDSPDHSHAQQGTFGTTNNNQSLTHSHIVPYAFGSLSVQAGPTNFGYVSDVGVGAQTHPDLASGDLPHNHNFTLSGATSGALARHQHPFSVTSAAQPGGGFETRPEAFVVIWCVKTGL